MRKTINCLLLLLTIQIHAQIQNAVWQVVPNPFNEDDEIEITVTGIDPAKWGSEDVYLWTWHYNSNDVAVNSQINWNGEWSNSKESMKMTKNQNGSFSFRFKPTELYQDQGIGKIGVLAKAKNGTGDKKTPDNFFEVGRFDVTINSPQNSPYVLSRNGSFNLSVSGSIDLNFVLKNEEEIIHSESNSKNFSKQILGPDSSSAGYKLNTSASLELVATDVNNTNNSRIIKFDIVVEPQVIEESPPIDLIDGINRVEDQTKVYLQLTAPSKDFVYVIGNFNNYVELSAYLMKKIPNSNTFWIEISNLNPSTYYYYQYSVYDKNPITNSPPNVKIADPYSELVLSPYDDPGISNLSFPDLPNYPQGQEREFTLFKSEKGEYNWKVENFEKPKKEDLVIYEILIRDFDKNRSFQDLIDRVDYFKNLNINAIELMPIMEFEGNESWGYNTAFHLALDKFYGTPEKLKELVDVYHQNGIAVILDLAINHVFGRNSLVRMWMNDPDKNGWGEPSVENPYLNTVPKHSYNVGYDFNHQKEVTQYYTQRVIKHWIEEYKIDGFRWDLTKGFTQNCSENDYDCTNRFQQDRVDILKTYADYSWQLDSTHYVIFEHLGTDAEEQEWTNYRAGEDKGIMVWGKMTNAFNELTMGFNDGANLSRMDYKSRGFLKNRLISYAESHDEERLMYKNLMYGNSSNFNHDVKNLEVSLKRMEALGSILLLNPGPKMIWHFSELGFENSLFTCEDGSNGGDACKLSTKPQPQWEQSWFENRNRKSIYESWAKFISLKKNEKVFEGEYQYVTYENSNLLPQVFVWNTQLEGNEIKYVYIISNFHVTEKRIQPNLRFEGEWIDMMDSSIYNVNPAFEIVLPPGTYKILGYKGEVCTGEDFDGDGLADFCDPDDDNDSILDSNDACPYTPLETEVGINGCEIFKLPVTNYTLKVGNASCNGASNGFIDLKIEDISYDYTVTITGQKNISLVGNNSKAIIKGLPKGEYDVCFQVIGQNEYNQCFKVQISEPEPLNVIFKVNENAKKISLDLSGAERYFIETNGNKKTINQNNFETELKVGYNYIKVYTESDCQGFIDKEVFISDKLEFYPNPTFNDVNVFVGGEDKKVKVSIYSTSGFLIDIREQIVEDVTRKIVIDLSEQISGSYIVILESKTINKTLKVIKK